MEGRGVTAVSLSFGELARLMPMHLAVRSDGQVLAAGPTLRKLVPFDPVGRSLSDIALLRRPHRPDLMDALTECAGLPLRMELRGPKPVRLVAVSARTEDGVLLNLSLGIGLADGVRASSLTIDDFAPTDLAAEFLYLVEANAAALAEVQTLAERLDAAREIAMREAETDPLTGLANRRALGAAVDRLEARRQPFALLLIDLDRFKAVNDRWGHEAGDTVLRAVSDRLRSAARRDDLAVRVGGDEFALLLHGDADRGRLREIADALIASIETPIGLRASAIGKPFAAVARISASVGIVRADGRTSFGAAELLQAADAHLYRAKCGGRGRAAGEGV